MTRLNLQKINKNKFKVKNLKLILLNGFNLENNYVNVDITLKISFLLDDILPIQQFFQLNFMGKFLFRKFKIQILLLLIQHFLSLTNNSFKQRFKNLHSRIVSQVNLHYSILAIMRKQQRLKISLQETIQYFMTLKCIHVTLLFLILSKPIFILKQLEVIYSPIMTILKINIDYSQNNSEQSYRIFIISSLFIFNLQIKEFDNLVLKSIIFILELKMVNFMKQNLYLSQFFLQIFQTSLFDIYNILYKNIYLYYLFKNSLINLNCHYFQVKNAQSFSFVRLGYVLSQRYSKFWGQRRQLLR
ncbi:unnamed protein product [Paramecium pentaurelia]|uniref:Transmembrane protein n=1 Tax=Paramecium pentaurelia TaxID=43138 RepID=A0A8S1YJS3_9CILI|nr:unnamed protein product [Paramecium pentaurelia]